MHARTHTRTLLALRKERPDMLLNILPGQSSSPQNSIQPNVSLVLKLRKLAGEPGKSAGTVRFQGGPGERAVW